MSRTPFATPSRTFLGEERGRDLPAFYCFADAYIGDSVQISTRNSIYTFQITAGNKEAVVTEAISRTGRGQAALGVGTRVQLMGSCATPNQFEYSGPRICYGRVTRGEYFYYLRGSKSGHLSYISQVVSIHINDQRVV